MKIKKKDLISVIESLDTFDKRKIKVELEQYSTDSISIVDTMYYIGLDNGDIEGNIILELGIGTGRLGIAALLFGGEFLIGIEKDQDAIEVLKQNVEYLNLEDKIIIKQFDINEIFENSVLLNDFLEEFTNQINEIIKKYSLEKAKTICIMNPPFGVQRKSADRNFLKLAMEVSDIIYSFHLSNVKNRNFIEKFIGKFGWKIDNIHSQIMKIKGTYLFHRKAIKEIKTDLYKLIPENC